MCSCSCGWAAGDIVGSDRKKTGAGCLGAQAGNPGAKHCRRKANGCNA